MRIFAKTAFLDGKTKYEEGQVYDVADERSMYFIAQNWATYAGKTSLWRRLRRKNG